MSMELIQQVISEALANVDLFMIVCLFALGFIIKENKRTIKESYFFKDLIEVIEKFEKKYKVLIIEYLI